MGLISKPTSDQLMIGDFIREKKKKIIIAKIEGSKERNQSSK